MIRAFRAKVLRRSQLYVPGNNERMIAKASSIDVDSVILDLEDSVPEDYKALATELLRKLSRELEWGNRELCVRINPRGTRHFSRDVRAVAGCRRVDSIVVPKAEGDCSSIARRTGKAVIPIVETASGLMNLRKVAASKGAVGITYGAADYASSVGGSVQAYVDNLAIKTLIASAAGAFNLDAIDNVFFDLDDRRGFRKEAMVARGLGFVGKQVVHPSQVPVANEVFSPTRKELRWARRIVNELGRASAGAKGAIRVDGKLVDAVHLRMAERTLERSRRSRAL